MYLFILFFTENKLIFYEINKQKFSFYIYSKADQYDGDISCQKEHLQW